MPNRVTELESKVAELEATVRGLTEELVDANERLRILESTIDPDGALERDRSRVADGANEDNTTKAAERSEKTEEANDVRAANADDERAANADDERAVNADNERKGDADDEGKGDEIIVA